MPARRASHTPPQGPAPRRDLPPKPQDGQADVIAFLSAPANYAGKVSSVETIATHASIIFLAGDFAYKLKRAVKYSYLDYSTPDLRRRACETEYELNRRTAPTLYRSAAAISRTAQGTLEFNGSGEKVDWVVVMRRFPQEALFSNLADRNLLTDRLVFDLAGRIAAFHATASIEPNHGGPEGAAAVLAINDENLRRSRPLDVADRDIDELRDASRDALAKYAGLLENRRSAGRVRRCHGDLHLGNICLIDDQPTLFDCIEFSDLISCIDVLYDLAFLLMDLRHRALTHQCSRVFNRYIDLADDEDGVPALSLFMSQRAAVRAHVVAAAANRADPPDQRDRKLAEAKSYFDLAIALLRPRAPRLIAIGGLSGTGKSTIAAAIAGDLGIGPGARILRSDVLRKRLFGKAPEQRLPAEAYSESVAERVYSELQTRAAALLRSGQSVIIDAVCARAEERTAIARVATGAGAAFTGLWLQAPEAVLRARLAARTNDASDATAETLRRQLTYDLGTVDWRRLDVDRSTADVLSEAWKALRD